MRAPSVRARPLLLALLTLLPLLAGCFTESARVEPAAEPAYPAGAHPWPRGDEWPAGLTGPFPLKEMQRVRVASHDGVPLDGWLFLPDVRGDVKLPTVYFASPYFGTMDATPDAQFTTQEDHWLPMRRLVENGFAVAAFNVRGTGNSGGCFDIYGLKEQLDHVTLVEWLGNQSWSNGRVGAMGLSYPGTTPMLAAIHAPPALKTVVVGAVDSDPYLLFSTPQGALYSQTLLTPLAFKTLTSDAPPALARREHLLQHPEPRASRGACAGSAVDHVEWAASPLASDRDGAFFDERRAYDHLGNVTASVFLTYGFHDFQVAFQDNVLWDALTQAPKRAVVGNWGHATPWMVDGDFTPLLAWLDFWLKGVGEPPAELGTVRYQDTADAWRETTAWPPPEARLEALHLTPGGLEGAPGTGARSFRAAPLAGGEVNAFFAEFSDLTLALCAAKTGAAASVALLYEGAPLEAPAVIAGNPFALLRVTSDAPGGLLSVGLVALPPGFRCEDAGRGAPARLLALGAADLRFHEGGFTGKDFPTGSPQDVRVDLSGAAAAVAEGERLAVLVTRGGPLMRLSQPFAPGLTLDGAASHVVLPLVEGTAGGGVPLADYPPRPFTRAALDTL